MESPEGSVDGRGRGLLFPTASRRVYGRHDPGGGHPAVRWPERKDTLRETDESIWGAIESFWSEVPIGSDVEIWFYSTPVEAADGAESGAAEGTTELYFLDGSATVSGIGFAPRGAVFESDS